MFSSSHAANPDRRGRRSNVKKTALSSRVALFSGITTSSAASAGSGSKITQESVSRSRQAVQASASLRQHNEQAVPVSIARRQSTGSSPTETPPTSVNVFAFLEHDPPKPFTTHIDAGVHNATKHTHDCTAPQEESDLDCSARSLHSDSGISIRDSSPDSSHHRSYSKPALHPLQEEDSPYGLRRSPLKSHPYYSNMRPVRASGAAGDGDGHLPQDEYFDGDPEAFYRDHIHSSRLVAPGSVAAAAEDPTSDLSGYDLLAARLADSYTAQRPLRPLYRKFTRLNHRILLQLQDEIAQMEEDLTGLDAADVRFRRGSTGQIAPESRRSNWQWHGSDLHAHRLDLLGRIYVKVEQYNQALAAFQNILKGSTSASQADVQHYRSWMRNHAPIAEVEQMFLDDPGDLLAFCPHKSCPTCEGHANLSPAVIKVIIIAFVMVTVLFTILLLVISPRIGALLIVSIAVALYAYRDEFTSAVTDCVNS